LAVAALDSIDDDEFGRLPDAVVVRGLETAYLPGRFERVSDNPLVVVDVAHNELSARVLAKSLSEVYAAHRRRFVLVVGLSKNHAPDTFLPPLLELKPDLVIATEPGFHPRSADEVADVVRNAGVTNVRVVKEGVRAAVIDALRSSGNGDIICLTGSFYTVGDIAPTDWPELISAGTLAQV
jgi:dihydrofolate synthase/folylpolyglutamate synthase